MHGSFISVRHPDKNKNEGAEDMFIKITKSYEVREYPIFANIITSAVYCKCVIKKGRLHTLVTICVCFLPKL